MAYFREQTFEIAVGPNRVAELLRKAIEWQALLESGEIVNQAEIARHEGVTRPRVTQIMGLLRLAPKIQEQILYMPDAARRPLVTERILRPIVTIADHHDQLREFQQRFSASPKLPPTPPKSSSAPG